MTNIFFKMSSRYGSCLWHFLKSVIQYNGINSIVTLCTEPLALTSRKQRGIASGHFETLDFSRKITHHLSICRNYGLQSITTTYLLLLLTLLTTTLFAQETPLTMSEDYTVENFTLPGGRLANNVNVITEGPNGFLWFGSHGGVHRYDGHEIITFKNEIGDTIAPTTSLTFPYVEHLYWDRDDKMWVSTYGGGLYRFDPITETFDHFAHDASDATSISHPRVMWSQEDADGRLWLSTDHGLCRFDRDTETFKRYYPFDGPENRIDNTFRNIYVDRQGTLWVSAGNAPFQDNGGLLRFNKSSDSFTIFTHDPNNPKSLSNNGTRALLEDREGNFWVGNRRGLNKMNRENGTFSLMQRGENNPSSPCIDQEALTTAFSMLEDQKGGLWIGNMGAAKSQSMLLHFDPMSQTAKHIPLETSAWHLSQSSDGTIWVSGAGMSGQVARIIPKTLTHDLQGGAFYQKEFLKVRDQIEKESKKIRGLLSSGPMNIGFDHNTGLLWASHMCGYEDGEATSVLSSFDRESGEVVFYHLPEMDRGRTFGTGVANFHVAGLYVTEDGKIWSSYPGDKVGVFSFDPKTGSVEEYLHDPDDSTSLSDNHVVDVYLDSRENLWISTFEEGLNKLNTKTGEITYYDLTYEHQQIEGNDNFPIAVAEDTAGMIWVAGNIRHFDILQLVKINPFTDDIKTFPFLDLKISSSIRSLAVIPHINTLAFTVFEGGMGYFDPENEQFVFHNTRLGNFPIDVTRKVLIDHNNNEWYSTREGIFICVNLAGEQKIIQNSNSASAEHRRGVVAPDGHLFFPTHSGWDEIDPDILNQVGTSDSLNLGLVDLYVLGEKQIPNTHETLDQPFWLTEEINLKHDAENFSFRFTDFDYQNRNLSHQYRLYPYESTWQKTGNEPIVNYFKVPTGNYEFQVRALNQTKAHSDEQLSIKVNILPPWWRTWWAYLGYALVSGFLIWFFVKNQRERAIRIERERSQQRELEQAKKLEVAYNKLKESEREAQIEAALERVRARTMAMYNTDELADASNMLFNEMREFGIDAISGFISLVNAEDNSMEIWLRHGDLMGEPTTVFGNNAVSFQEEINAWKKGTPFLKNNFPKEDFISQVKSIFNSDVEDRLDKTHFYLLHIRNKFGFLGLGTWDDTSEDDYQLFNRFTKVFEQTYTRFLDLQKAETQAREAQIEASLERVRSASMAMHSSDGLPNILSIMFDEFGLFNSPDEYRDIELFIIEEETGDATAWTTDQNLQNAVTSYPFSFHITSAAKKEYIKWKETPFKQRKDLIINSFYEGQSWERVLADFDKTEELREIASTFRKNGITQWATHHAYFSHGMVALQQQIKLDKEDVEILQRFAKVFEQTYTRFLDLQKAEAQAREAKIEAVLERVRAASMAMHKSKELIEVCQVLFGQIANIGLKAESSWISLSNAEEDTQELWAVHGNQIAYRKVNGSDHPNFRASIDAFKSKKKFVQHCTPKEDFTQAVKHIFDFDVQDQADKSDFYLLEVLHRFGFIGIGTWDEVNKEDYEVYSRFAKVFEQTYTRFLDLQKAEEQAAIAKKQSEEIEKAYENLKSTQAQLIQSEKMASLGELTAGIAHEIQNPLNFVNNFSDVSGELIEEAIEELDKNDIAEAKDILSDLKGNLEKISHHGSRASGIVKGMLDHSRASTGEKSPTDINALCDEYLRLSYHGLRAKDKSFNAAFETDFDESLPKINVVSQDIGRVLLNVINNAFYACAERSRSTVDQRKKSSEDVGYEPKVSIATSQIDDRIEIRIKDNGIGMSQETIDKVFQPFFTTKPTGQGTGLGMSISYDIVTKGHGGELKVESLPAGEVGKKGRGSTFIIELPQ